MVRAELCPDLVGFGDTKAGVDGQSVPPSFTGADVVAGGRVGVAEALMSAGLLVCVSALVGQNARIVVPTQGVPGLAHGEQVCSQAVERFGLTVAVFHLAADGQGHVVVLGGASVAALPPVQVAEVVQGVGLTFAVRGIAEQGEGLVQVTGGLRVAALRHRGFTEAGLAAA